MIRVALVHDWLTGMRGGEAVLEAIAELFPQAEIFTLLRLPDRISPQLARLKCHTSWLQKVPGADRKYRNFLPLMPSMIEGFDLSGYDLIISSSHCVAKGVRKAPGAVHVSYVHAPMRYIWDRYEDYFGPGRSSGPVRLAAGIVRRSLQRWDQKVSTLDRIDGMMANSRFIAGQIERIYQRPARVVYPFVDLERFDLKQLSNSAPEKKDYLMVTAFAPYKRIDLAIDAFNLLGLPLTIVGTGQDEDRLKSRAGSTIHFAGSLPSAAVTQLYLNCKALIFPGIEDFGITPLEAMAAGSPVIAYGEGGACETVTEKTGILFPLQTVESLVTAIQELEEGKRSFQETECRAQARLFSKDRFRQEFYGVVRNTWNSAGKETKELS